MPKLNNKQCIQPERPKNPKYINKAHPKKTQNLALIRCTHTAHRIKLIHHRRRLQHPRHPPKPPRATPWKLILEPRQINQPRMLHHAVRQVPGHPTTATEGAKTPTTPSKPKRTLAVKKIGEPVVTPTRNRRQTSSRDTGTNDEGRGRKKRGEKERDKGTEKSYRCRPSQKGQRKLEKL